MSLAEGVAFTAMYTDGGAVRVGGVGYRGLTNCADGTHCAHFRRRGLRPRARPRGTSSLAETWCYEALLLKPRRWRIGTGISHHCSHCGQAMPMRKEKPCDIATLTTRLSGADEAGRDCAEGEPDWRTGLFGYLGPDATNRIVSEVAFLLGDRHDKM